MNTLFWGLPGPRRFAAQTLDELSEGRSVVIVCPNADVPNGIQEIVAGGLSGFDVHELKLSEVLPSDLGLPGARAASVTLAAMTVWGALDLPQREGERRDGVALARHPELGRRVLLLDARGAGQAEAEIVTLLLRDFASATKELPRYQRAAWLVLLAPTDQPGDTLDALLPPSDVTLAVRWWWGVLGPLDVAVWVEDRVRDRPVEEAVRISVADVAGPDLGLAEELLARWDGGLAALDRCIASWSELTPELLAHGAPVDGPAGQRPSPALLLSWSAGAVESWADQLWYHVCSEGVANREAARRRVWLAQVSRIFPMIERERTRLADWVVSLKIRPAPAWESADLAALEVGELRRWVWAHDCRVTPARRDLLEWLVKARNRLAHREALEPAFLRDGWRLIRADRRSETSR